MSGFIRQNPGIFIQNEDVEFLASLRTPTVAEKALKLLLQIVREYPSPGEGFTINYWSLQSLLKAIDEDKREEFASDLNFTKGCQSALYWLAVSWAKDFWEFEFLMCEYLMGRKGILEGWKVSGWYVVTAQGWDHLDSLRTADSSSETGFVAMWFQPIRAPCVAGSHWPGHWGCRV